MWNRDKRKEISRPSRLRVTHFALEVLREAAAQALEEPIERTVAHRLALAWLTHMDFATPQEADYFWRILGHAQYYDNVDPSGPFRRKCDPPIYLKMWKERAINGPRPPLPPRKPDWWG
jgi:hypothetical protein